jgi:hypothetical protein
MSVWGWAGTALAVFSVGATVAAAFLLRVYLRNRREKIIALFVNSGAAVKDISGNLEMLARGEVSLENVIKRIHNYDVLKKLEKFRSKRDMVTFFYNLAGLKAPDWMVSEEKWDDSRNSVIKELIFENMKSNDKRNIPKGFDKIGDLMDLIETVEGMDMATVKNFLEEFKSKPDGAKERMIQNEKVRAVLSRADSVREIISYAKQSVAEEMKERYNELKSSISALRKKGNDVEMIDMKLMAVPPKMRGFELTGDRAGVAKVREIFEEIEKEIKADTAPVKTEGGVEHRREAKS